jgi:hypothetical protein
MGKRKQAKPRRNVNATVSEAAQSVPLKRRRRIVDDDDEDSASSADVEIIDEKSRQNGRTDSGDKDTGGTLNQPLVKNSKESDADGAPSKNELLDQAVKAIYSDVDETRSSRRIQDPVHLEAILDYLLFTKGSKGTSECLLPAILEFDMLRVYITRTRIRTDLRMLNDSSGVLQNCIFRDWLLLPQGSDYDYSFQVSVCLTDVAYQQASPEAVSTYLLGTNTIRRKHKALHATLSLRRALASLFPNTLIDAVHSDPSGRNADPVKARLVYGLVDNVQFQAKCRNIDEGTGAVPPTTVAGLRPTMRRYQSYAVEWMLSREKDEEMDDGIWETCWLVLAADSFVQPLTEYLKSAPKCGHDALDSLVLVNPFTGSLCRSVKAAKVATVGPDYTGVRGGILAESMGK